MQYYKKKETIFALKCTKDNLAEIKQFAKYFCFAETIPTFDSNQNGDFIKIQTMGTSNILEVNEGSFIFTFGNGVIGTYTGNDIISSRFGLMPIPLSELKNLFQNYTEKSVPYFKNLILIDSNVCMQAIKYTGKNLKTIIKSKIITHDIVEYEERGIKYIKVMVGSGRSVTCEIGTYLCNDGYGISRCDTNFLGLKYEKIGKGEYEEYVNAKKSFIIA